MSFDNQIIWSGDIGGFTLWITETTVGTWIIMAVLIAFAIVARLKLKSFSQAPKGFQNVVELIVETFDRFTRNTAGENLRNLGYWYFMAFAFIFSACVYGLFGMRPPTADWSMTLVFGLSTFFLIIVTGIKYKKGAYFKGFLDPFPVFLPLNIIGELARPISLSLRLFGNILSGMVLISLIYGIAPLALKLGLPVVLHGYFDLASGLLQTYIFTVLSLTFIGASAED